MIDDNKITEAANEICDYGSLYNSEHRIEGFKKGAKWAINEFYRLCGIHGMPLECIKYEKGCKNKMFVNADLMPHSIRITDIRAERLQDISEEDCIAEGIKKNPEVLRGMWEFSYIKGVTLKFEMSTTPRGAYAKLIDHISGKGTWESNPYVFVYEFELIK